MPKNELNMGILWLCLCKILSVNAPFCSWCTGYHIMSAAAALIDGVGLYVHLAITSIGVVTNPLIIYVLCKYLLGVSTCHHPHYYLSPFDISLPSSSYSISFQCQAMPFFQMRNSSEWILKRMSAITMQFLDIYFILALQLSNSLHNVFTCCIHITHLFRLTKQVQGF